MVLGLFFTFDVSLKDWVESGLFDREKLIYEKHILSGKIKKIYWFTYGKNDQNIIVELVSQIIIVPMPAFFSHCKLFRCLYSVLLPFIHSKKIKECNLLKTNQMLGSWTTVISKLIFNKKMILRTGYTLTKFPKSEKKSIKNILKTVCYFLIEFIAYKVSNKIIVTSFHDADYVKKIYKVDPEKIKLVPNYIDTEKFFYIKKNKFKDRIIYVGRLSSEKNLINLIGALKNHNLTLDIYGSGVLLNELKNFAKEKNVSVNFYGNIPNYKLPEIYNRYSYFALCSKYEGMPKTLLEAMSCGLICLGTDVTGINEIIKDEFNGLLSSGIDSHSIAKAIEKLKSLDEAKVAYIRENSINFIKAKVSLDSIFKKEIELFKELHE